MEFPTSIHQTAHKHYNHCPDIETRDSVGKILINLTEEKVGVLKKIYSDSNQFNRFKKIKIHWDKYIKGNDDAPLKGSECDILIYLLNMLLLEDCRNKRKIQLKKLRH